MFEFEKPRIEIAEQSDDDKFGRFVIEPLERGYGTTLGNSLRRIMLSSLPGTAVSSVKIKGVLHEFSSIPGVKEDVTEIILNIKDLVIKNNSSSNEPKTAYIEASGTTVVTAADIKVDGLDTFTKSRQFSLFGKRPREEFFNECYSVNYTSSFAALAQAHRHKPIKYEFLGQAHNDIVRYCENHMR